MAEMLPETIRPAAIEGAQAPARPTHERRRSERSVLASVGLHGTLVLATFCALFPIAWVVLSSIKPASEIRRS
jgi:arabinogalactan oligomer/maltooligosaccharide transport system permease protein